MFYLVITVNKIVHKHLNWGLILTDFQDVESVTKQAI